MNGLTFFRTNRILTRCEVSLKQDSSCAIHVDETDEIAKWVDYRVVNKELIVHTKPEYYGLLLLSGKYPKIKITFIGLSGLQILDRAHVFSTGVFTVAELGIIVRGGSVDLTVNATVVDCTLLKRARANIKGSTCLSRVLVYQQGIYEGDDLEASEVCADVHGDGRASVWATEEMELGLFGQSSISICGSPRMNIPRIDKGCSIKSFNKVPLIESDI